MEPLFNPKWNGFSEYRTFRERGLRREALQHLSAFVEYISNCSFAERKEFVTWLFSQAEEAHLLPHSLKVRVIEPLLREWIAREPTTSTPHMWLGGIPNLWEAHRLDPSNPEVKLQLVEKVLKGIDYEMHELPWGFLGDDVDGCFALLLRLRHLLSGVPSSPEVTAARQEIEGRTEILANLVAYQRDSLRDQDETFKNWCIRLGRRGSW